MMFAPFEEYALLNEETLEKVKTYLRDSVAEELLLSISYEPLLEITKEDLDQFKEIMDYWRKGHAMPVSALEELRRIRTGSPSIVDLRRGFVVTLYGEEISVEPDVNLEFAQEFVDYIEAKEILDIASGFGWIPPLFSRKGRVLALDNSYSNRIIFDKDGKMRVEGTNIELFPDWPSAKEYIMKRKKEFREYKDFAKLFWRSHGANLDNIVLLRGDATDLRNCYDLTNGRESQIGDNSIQTVTCFFGLNHIGKLWKDVLRETYRVLTPEGIALISIYKEYLERFPLKFAYNWTRKLGIEIIKIEELEKFSGYLKFEFRLIKNHRLFYLISLRKR
jgi:SAM-dependent methyltransferase